MTRTITRTFDAPVEKVWQAWTDQSMLSKWWGPREWAADWKADARVGGKYHYKMSGAMQPGGPVQDMYGTGTYKEVEPMKKLVLTDSFSDADGTIINASVFGMQGWPDELLVTLTFEDAGDGKTAMTLVHEGLPEGEMGDMTMSGWNESLDKLSELVA